MRHDAGRAPHLQVQGVSKTFADSRVLKEVSFHAGQGEFLCVLGPSGCGKTTLLRIVAGLETQEQGRVLMAGQDVSTLPVSKRNVGIVFQSYALFPNLTARENIAYGLRLRRGEAGKEAARRRVAELVNLVGLQGMESKYPAQLSGGQQQRVALARAMALSPGLLLLDEPLSALDAKVRLSLRWEIRHLQQKLGVTTIMVTHDQEEALTMADRILVMRDGEIIQEGSPFQVYEKPATRFVASFIGQMNFIEGASFQPPDGLLVFNRRFRVRNGTCRFAAGERVTMAIRPEDLTLEREPRESDNCLQVAVSGIEFRGGAAYRLALTPPVEGLGEVLLADVPASAVRGMGLAEDMTVTVGFPADRIRLYPFPHA